ncbi:hypothetical protein [Tunturiibacter psychrotolerans]|uniref:hypothetical protein n=1 Tax=Tunturiibacter psychrotolerans TaxID=3069686 RepID=UPI003D1AB2BB
MPLAKKLAGLKRYEISDGSIVTLLVSPDVFRIGTCISTTWRAPKGVCKPGGAGCGEDRQIFAPDDSGVQMFLFDSREV